LPVTLVSLPRRPRDLDRLAGCFPEAADDAAVSWATVSSFPIAVTVS
jgi:hypothetical protein